MNPLSYVFIFLGGIIVGILGALLGIGGGIFFIPFLVLIFHIPMHQAIGTSIVTVIATSSAVASINVGRGWSNIRLGMTLELATTIGAIFGGVTANLISGATLAKIFSIIAVVIGFLMLRKVETHEHAKPIREEEDLGKLGGSFYDAAEGKEIRYRVKKPGIGLVASFIAGNISGLLGIGGGVIKVPAMNLWCNVPIKAATATSNFMIGVTAVASAFIYFAAGQIEPRITAAAAIGVLLGSRIGLMIGDRLHSRWITTVFALLLFGLAVEMFLR